MTLSVVTPPEAEPLVASDALLRQHLRLEADETDQDEVLAGYCAAARQLTEDYTRRRMITQTLQLRLDGFGCGGIDLGVSPVQEIVSIRWLDFSGIWQTLDAARYRLITSREPHQVMPAYGQTWPVPRTDRDTVAIEFVAGFGETAADVPPQLLQVMRVFVAHMFENRTGEVPVRLLAMLDRWRVWV
ncbi:head-tail connector protein [Roseivivax isoporae]|uniref:PhiE125 gp8 family phage protein n=1 Tax=Roseivivax isoporae LMG 25204 TaxID=1449351 RepID=X7F141_9RHOB|nr:hypothetical protein [Roseivivax isoporae]ETX26607.1 hypothetical protein RISW2_21815 [Roseivivax isoporae LMG 25204]